MAAARFRSRRTRREKRIAQLCCAWRLTFPMNSYHKILYAVEHGIARAAASAKFGYPEVNIGFVPAMVMAILRRSLSEKRAFELIATGEIISAQTAVDYGMINRVFADETFDLDVDAYASKLASKSASAIMLTKRLLYHMDTMSFEAAIEAGVETNAIARMTEDMKRGLEKFLKRT